MSGQATDTLGTDNCIAEADDGYDTLADAIQTDSGEPNLARLVIDRARERTPISPKTEGRITRV